MPKKEDYCNAIAAKHGLIVNFEGEPPGTRVPNPIDDGGDETFSQWTKRVLGNDVTDVSVWVPVAFGGGKRMRNLQHEADASHVKQMFRSLGRIETHKRRKATEAAVEKVERKLVGIPKDTLEDILADFEEHLQPSVREFFDRFLEETDEDIETEHLLMRLIERYNALVKQLPRPNIAETSATEERHAT